MSALRANTDGRNRLAGLRYIKELDTAWADATAPRSPDAPTVISTFAGGGGSSLGYHMAGFRELLAVEWDDNAVATLRINFPHLDIHHGDIAKLSVDEALTRTGLAAGQLDVLDGSPPCQGFSTAGSRVLDDPRNSLFREFVRLLRGLQPRVFVMENVTGMIKGKMKLIFAEVLRELKASGYDVSARVLNAMNYGVPQSRERMIFIGVRADLGIKASHPQGETRAITFRDATAGITDKGAPLGAFLLDFAKVQPQGAWSSEPKQWKSLKGSLASSMSTKWCAWDATPGTIIKEWIAITGMIHPDRDRYVSIPEIKRIASFPDAYQFCGLDKQKIERMGNSVPPLLARAIARHIRGNILTTEAKP